MSFSPYVLLKIAVGLIDHFKLNTVVFAVFCVLCCFYFWVKGHLIFCLRLKKQYVPPKSL